MTIERNIPFDPYESRMSVFKFPLDDLELKESFFTPDVAISTIKQRIQRYYKVNGKDKKFSCQRSETGVRVWRVK